MLVEFFDCLETELNQHANLADKEADRASDTIEKMCCRMKEEVFRGLASAIHDAMDQAVRNAAAERIPDELDGG